MTDPTVSAESTWQWIQPVLSTIGVTRIADITWLDEVGIPCWQAIRPASRTLSVSQGKGRTPLLAAISAGMEAIEVWHVENLGPSTTVATPGEFGESLGYPVSELRLARRSCLNRDSVLEWTLATRLTDGSRTQVPTASLRLDSTVEETWDPILFEVTSNGLASGRTRDDAALHGLCEVVERDAIARTAGRRPRMDLETLPETAASLVERFHRAGIEVVVEVAESPVGIPCFAVRVFSEDFPVDFVGSAANPDAEVALCGALAEAAQSRVAAIAGTREDLTGSLFDVPWAPIELDAGRSGSAAFTTGTFTAGEDVTADTARLAERVRAITGHAPLLVEHTRPELGVPVVRVVCPGMSCPEDY